MAGLEDVVCDIDACVDGEKDLPASVRTALDKDRSVAVWRRVFGTRFRVPIFAPALIGNQ